MGFAKKKVVQEAAEDNRERQIIGTDPAMKKILHQLGKIAVAEAPVIITGESGTGKELIARAIHHQSRRCHGPFMAVNCGALPANLIQSELFGHRKGSFTGANYEKVGRIEAAHGGTILLDEIGDLPFDLQVNLLRFLQEGTIDKVGGTDPIHVDVRVIAATNVNLHKAVEEGRFREDLFYRLHVLQLELPPLRDRPGDIETLADFYLRDFISVQKLGKRTFCKSAVAAMKSFHWPGNIRELINRVRRAAIMSEGTCITPADLGLEDQVKGKPMKSLAEVRAEAERQAIQKSLSLTGNNISEAARQLNISRIYLYRLLEKHGIAHRGNEDSGSRFQILS